MDTTLQKMIDHGLIEESLIADIAPYIGRKQPCANSTYLRVLFEAKFKQLTGGSYFQLGIELNFGGEESSPVEQSKINKELLEFLAQLKSCGIISDLQLEQFTTKIGNNEFSDTFQLLDNIIEQAEIDELMNPEDLKVFADKLKNKGIVGSNYDTLIVDIERRKLQNPIEFLHYCSKSVIVYKQDFSNDLAAYLELIHQKTASVLPELEFTNFEFQIVLNNGRYDFVVSFTSNGKKYKHKSFYGFQNPNEVQYDGAVISGQDYYRIFNKILADLQSPYRLHHVHFHRGNSVDSRVFGIIALTKEQADVLHGNEVFFSPSYEDFKANLTSKKIEQAIEGYQKIGLFAHLSSDQIERAKENVTEQENHNLNYVLMAFPDIILSFDMELGNLTDPYAELVREFRKISHDEFNATEITDIFDFENANKGSIQFKIGAKSYRKKLKIESDWMDLHFFDFIKSVVTENELNGQFYDLYTEGQDASVIYLSKEQYEYLRANKLLLFSDQWELEGH